MVLRRDHVWASSYNMRLPTNSTSQICAFSPSDRGGGSSTYVCGRELLVARPGGGGRIASKRKSYIMSRSSCGSEVCIASHSSGILGRRIGRGGVVPPHPMCSPCDGAEGICTPEECDLDWQRFFRRFQARLRRRSILRLCVGEGHICEDCCSWSVLHFH